MGLQETITAGVAAAFKATADIHKAAVLTQPSTLDDVTEAETPGATTAPNILVAQYKAAEVNGADVQMGDMKALVQAADVDFSPDLGMTVLVDGETWMVMNVNDISKLGIVFIVQLRKPK